MSKNKKPISTQRISILFLMVFFLLTPIQTQGIDFIQSVSKISFSRYEHWRADSNQKTGSTDIRYDKALLNQAWTIVETSRNIDAKGVVYGEKISWFSVKTGRLLKSTESDFRSKTRVTNKISNNVIHTELKAPNQIKRLQTTTEPRLILFETLSLGLQALIPEILDNGQARFTLFVPALALELEKYKLPQSMSKIRMLASIENITARETVMGQRKTVQVLIRPESFFLRSILPRSKTEFRFIYLVDNPYYLIRFQDAVGSLRLVDLKLSE